MQHCPNCGAENNEEAQFCAECGAPLDTENEVVEVDDDPTLLSTNISELIEAQKTEIFEGSSDEDDGATIQISSAEIVEATAQEPQTPPPAPSGDEGDNGGTEVASSGGWMTQRNIIIAIVVLLVLCCCFFAIVGGGLMAFSQNFPVQ